MWQGIECNLWPIFSEKQSPKPIPLQGTESCQKMLCELEGLETWLQLQPTPCLQPRKPLKHAWNPDACKLRGFKPTNFRVFCNATVDNWYRLTYLSLCFRASIFYSWCLFPNFFILVGLYIFFIPVFLFCYGFRKETYAVVEPSVFYRKSPSNFLLQTECVCLSHQSHALKP